MVLTDVLNKDQLEIRIFRRFQDYKGAIPQNITLIKEDGRKPAGGSTILPKRLNALQSKDAESIEAWGKDYFDFADAGVVFEDKVKIQPDSPLLTGIVGIVNQENEMYVAVDAKSVSSAVSDMKYFNVTEAKVTYLRRKEDGSAVSDTRTVDNVVLLPYNGRTISFTADQFKVIKANEFSRDGVVYGKDMEKGEIVDGKRVIHPAWASYDSEVVVPLVDEVFKFNKREYKYDKNMGFFLPNAPKENGEMRALYVGRLDDGSRLCAGNDLGGGSGRLLGVAEKPAEGGKKINSAYITALRNLMDGKNLISAPAGDYAKLAGRVNPVE